MLKQQVKTNIETVETLCGCFVSKSTTSISMNDDFESQIDTHANTVREKQCEEATWRQAACLCSTAHRHERSVHVDGVWRSCRNTFPRHLLAVKTDTCASMCRDAWRFSFYELKKLACNFKRLVRWAWHYLFVRTSHCGSCVSVCCVPLSIFTKWCLYHDIAWSLTTQYINCQNKTSTWSKSQILQLNTEICSHLIKNFGAQ